MRLHAAMVRMKSKPFLGLLAGLYGVFKSVKVTKVDVFFGNIYLGYPFVDLAMTDNSRDARDAGNPYRKVFVVLRQGNVPKVLKSVVQSVAVDMVNRIFWKLPSFDHPNQSMDQELLPIDGCLKVAKSGFSLQNSSSASTDFNPIAGLQFPDENAFVASVLKYFQNPIFIHDWGLT